MEHPNQMILASSPTLYASGKTENLSESKRKTEQGSKKQQFRGPTISTASKGIMAPKKDRKILAKMGATRPKIALRKPESVKSSCLTDRPKRVSVDSQSSCTVVENEAKGVKEGGMGWKRVLLKCLIVLSGLVLSAVHLCAMNSNMNNTPMISSPAVYQENVECLDFGDLNFGMVSLRGKWVFDEGEESVMGVSEKFNASEFSDKFLQDQVPILIEEEDLRFDNAIDHSDDFEDYQRIRAAQKVETEAPIAAESRAVLDPNFVTLGEKRIPDLASVVETVAEVPEPRIKVVESQNEVKNVTEFTDGIREVNIFEVDDKEVRLPQRTDIWLVQLAIKINMICVAVCLSRKGRRVFTRGEFLRRRLNPQAEREDQTRLVEPTPRVGLDPVHLTSEF